MKHLLLAGLAGLSVLGGAAHAADAPSSPLAACTALSDAHRASTFGTQYVLIEDGDAHYRLRFRGGDCNALALVTRIEIASEQTDNQLCPQGTRVKTQRGNCDVSAVDLISEDRYKSLRRRR